MVVADSLSRSCSGVNLSTCHQCKPGGHGTPRRSYGVVLWRRPAPNVWQFQDRRLRSKKELLRHTAGAWLGDSHQRVDAIPPTARPIKPAGKVPHFPERLPALV